MHVSRQCILLRLMHYCAGMRQIYQREKACYHFTLAFIHGGKIARKLSLSVLVSLSHDFRSLSKQQTNKSREEREFEWFSLSPWKYFRILLLVHVHGCDDIHTQKMGKSRKESLFDFLNVKKLDTRLCVCTQYSPLSGPLYFDNVNVCYRYNP